MTEEQKGLLNNAISTCFYSAAIKTDTGFVFNSTGQIVKLIEQIADFVEAIYPATSETPEKDSKEIEAKLNEINYAAYIMEQVDMPEKLRAHLIKFIRQTSGE